VPDFPDSMLAEIAFTGKSDDFWQDEKKIIKDS
jgi:hypothetical protein